MEKTAAAKPVDKHADKRIERIRRFNRFYTRHIGALNEHLLQSPFSLAESRLLWEFAHHEQPTASQLAQALALDAGYLSRLLRNFKDRGLVKSLRSSDDARQFHLSLTAAGRKAFMPLDARSQEEVMALLAKLSEAQQQQLLQAMETIETTLSPASITPYLLRAHRPGDIGWAVSRHGALYAQEYRWDMRFEALVARIAADFIERFDAQSEACWIAERGGCNVGCVFLVQARDEVSGAPLHGTAQLRMLLVEPAARGLGLGSGLVQECERFARQAGYARIRLWTNHVLSAARSLYQQAGYRMTASETHHSFGHDLIGETWELALH